MIYSKYKILTLFLLLSIANTGYVGYFHHHKSEHCNSEICHKDIKNFFCSHYSLEEKHDEKYGKCEICELISIVDKYAIVTTFDIALTQNPLTFQSRILFDYKNSFVEFYNTRAPPDIS